MDALLSLGQGSANYLSKIQSNKNARAQNATNDKWGPLLALNTGGGGAKNREVPNASFAEIMGPAIQSAINSTGKGGGGGMNASSLIAGGQGESTPAADGGISELLGGAGPAMFAATGGKIPGRSMVPGNSPLNDTKMTMTSPGEVVLPRTVAQEGMKGNKWKVASYLNEVKKHGPGPMPVKNSQNKPKSSSLSPWQAMACGGMTR